MEQSKISVIMGVYNCEKILPIAIHSILEQTYDNWELIMCEDGSQDQTYKIASEFEKKYPGKIKVIRNHGNSGLAKSLNNCLEYAEGEYIARMDADDYAYPERFQKQIEFFEKNKEYDLVASAVDLYDGKNIVGQRIYKSIPDVKSLLLGVPFIHPTIMMRRSAYDALQGYTVNDDTKRCEDLDLWFRFYQKGYKGYNLSEPLLKYHESLEDYKKRSVKSAIQISKVRIRGYKLLEFSRLYYPLAIKPLISALVPNKLMYLYHKKIQG